MATTLTPRDTFKLANAAYRSLGRTEEELADQLDLTLGTIIEKDSVHQITAQSGNISPTTTGFGFIARGKGNHSNQVFVCTRGTQSWDDVSTDLNFLPTQNNQGGQVHRGFKKTFDSYTNNLTSLVKKTCNGQQLTAVHCIGHSLGGALANLNAAALSSGNQYPVKLYTLASPRVGLSQFSEFLDSYLTPTNVFRVANLSDPVTMLPCFPFMHGPLKGGYYNVGSTQLKVNPFNHMMGVGYKVMNLENQSWNNLKNGGGLMQLDRLKQNAKSYLEKNLTILGDQIGAAMHSTAMLQAIGYLITKLVGERAYQGMVTNKQWASGAFTTLDRLAEAIYLSSLTTAKANETAKQIVISIFHFLGQKVSQAVQVTRTLLVQVFRLLQSTLVGMVKLALGRVDR